MAYPVPVPRPGLHAGALDPRRHQPTPFVHEAITLCRRSGSSGAYAVRSEICQKRCFWLTTRAWSGSERGRSGESLGRGVRVDQFRAVRASTATGARWCPDHGLTVTGCCAAGVDDSRRRGGRRRVRARQPRRRQVVVRFTDAEFEQVHELAALAGAAVGAWIGERVLAASDQQVGITELLRLHADVTAIREVVGPAEFRRLDALLEHLDAAVDAVVRAAVGGGRHRSGRTSS